MQKDAINFAKQAFQENKSLKDVAWYIKGEFDKKHRGKWSCTAGIEQGYS